MDVPLSAARPGMTVPMRTLLFGLATLLGFLVGIGWNVDAANWAYNLLPATFADPGAPIGHLAVGVVLGFLLGLIHFTSV